MATTNRMRQKYTVGVASLLGPMYFVVKSQRHAYTKEHKSKKAKENFDLIGFGDASEKAYRMYLYAVSKNSKDKSNSQLFTSKSRVAPLKTISLPRLE